MRAFLLPACLLATATATSLVRAQAAADGPGDTQEHVDGLHADTERGGQLAKKGLSVVALPIPKSDPTLGAGLTLPVLLLYDPNPGSRPWMTGVGAMYTSSKSWAAGAFQKAYLFDNQLRLTASVGYADLHLDYYGTGAAAGSRGVSVPIRQRAPLAYVKALWGVSPHLFAGLRYHHVTVDTSVQAFHLPGSDFTVPGFDRDVTVSAFGLAGEFDTRDSELNPRRGSFASASIDFPRDSTGSTYDFNAGRLAVNHYLALDTTRTVAMRASLCATSGDVPYFSLCQFGSQGDLRGYETGRYRDRALFATQAEYRWRFHARWGAVVFGGVGGVASQVKETLAGSLLPSAGLGVRWQASTTYDMNLAADMAWGRDGARGFYLRIGEAF